MRFEIGGACHQQHGRRRQTPRDQCGIGQPSDTDSQIIAAARDIDAAIVAIERQLDLRMSHGEFAEDPAQIQTGEGERRSHPERPAQGAFCTGAFFERGIEFGQDALGPRIEGRARFGRLAVARGAADQFGARRLFEFRQPLGGHRFGDVETARRWAEPARLDDGHKGRKGFEAWFHRS